jgi:hypothetical protein
VPTNQELAVILKFRDEMTAAFTRTTQAAGRQLDQLGHQIKAFGQQLVQAGRNMRFLGAEITGVLAVSLAVAQRYSIQTSNAIRDMSNQSVRLHLVIAQALVPVLESLTAVISKAATAFEEMNPATRDAIIQWTAIGGILLLVGGQLISTWGHLAKLVGQILIWASSLTVAYGGIVLLVAVIGTVIVAFVGWQKALIGIARAFDVLMQAIKFLINLLETGLFRVMAFGLGVWEKWIRLLAALDGPLGKNAANLRKSAAEARALRQELDKTSMGFAGDAVKDLELLIERFKEGGGTAEDFVRHLQDMIDKLKGIKPAGVEATNFILSFKAAWNAFVKETLDLGTKAGNAIVGFFKNVESGVAKSIENILLHGGKFKDFLKGLGQTIRQAFISMISQLIAAVVVAIPIALAIYAIPVLGPLVDLALRAQSMGSIAMGANLARGFGAQRRHQGGVIQRFATGGEVLAMLEPGEFVVNRNATERNRELLESVNSGRGTGEQGGGKGIAVVFNINAIDPKTGAEFLLRNSKAIADAVGQEILRNNQSYRRTSRRFA